MRVLDEEREQETWRVRLEKNEQGEEVHVARSKGCKVSMVHRMDRDENRLCSECWRVLRKGASFKAFVLRRNIDDARRFTRLKEQIHEQPVPDAEREGLEDRRTSFETPRTGHRRGES